MYKNVFLCSLFGIFEIGFVLCFSVSKETGYCRMSFVLLKEMLICNFIYLEWACIALHGEESLPCQHGVPQCAMCQMF